MVFGVISFLIQLHHLFYTLKHTRICVYCLCVFAYRRRKVVWEVNRVRRRGSVAREEKIKQRVSSRLSDRSLDKVQKSAPSDRSHNNPTFHGSIEEAWFDSAGILDSDCDEDFESVQDGRKLLRA
ncbi:uncharacterized protein LOC132302950 isoform X2 [Cornus florida]|uniref:uncharacterized protein LOC132302950 isoform X2 n=1 Tax=Cornus florida TaxID=4283 RepID=UPI00289A4649|nr:uncharacterized protein LOC132302950 isoform X2 [Cornus florida]